MRGISEVRGLLSHQPDAVYRVLEHEEVLDLIPSPVASRASKIVQHSPVPVVVAPRGVAAELADRTAGSEAGRA